MNLPEVLVEYYVPGFLESCKLPRYSKSSYDRLPASKGSDDRLPAVFKGSYDKLRVHNLNRTGLQKQLCFSRTNTTPD